MLKDGLYEQIVNQQILEQLQALDPERYQYTLDNLSASDAYNLLTIYLSQVIRSGLRYLRDSYKSKEEAESLLAQLSLANSIIDQVAKHTQDQDYQDLQILEKGEILTSIYEKVAQLKKTFPIRPETSLVENTLFTGSKTEPSMLSELKKEIASSDRIDFLVSFIKWSAIRPLLGDLETFTKKGHHLRIIATTYTKATDYKAILALSQLPNTEVKINYETQHAHLHAKSYLFWRESGFSTAYIGSSNLSNTALTSGLEWNVKVTEQESIDIVNKFVVSFESYWNDPAFETFDPDNLACQKKLKQELSKTELSTFHLESSIRPYSYQQDILDQLYAEREVYGHDKNLLVAATGVGKTVIAAFDFKRFLAKNPGAKLLFVAHRQEILEQSLQKFREVLNDFNFGQLYVGGYKPDDLSQLFVSIQSFNSGKIADLTPPDYYDFIIIDEFHHAAAKSYQKLLAYYQPKILLGLTATPERMDGQDVLKYFDGRIASQMLLGEAIDRQLLAPFQYYGVTDNIDYSSLKWSRGQYEISELENVYTASDARANLIVKNTVKYLGDLSEVKGLAFCVSVKHAEFMANYFNRHHIPSASLSGQSKKEDRKRVKEDLISGKIRFIFVVDLYNEGVDIPCVNTILFLRPTQSPTIFLQQLGRGLRLYPGKDCLTVLDFIGQANRNYSYQAKFRALIGPSHHRLSQEVEDKFPHLPAGCYVELEPVAEKYILNNLKQNTANKLNLIKQVGEFSEVTGKELTLANFLDEYEMSLYDFYQANGSRSLHRLKKWAGLIDDDRDVENSVYQKFSSFFHIDSKPLLDFWIAYLTEGREGKEDKEEYTANERLMVGMLYYSFYKKKPAQLGFRDLADGIFTFVKEDFVKNELLEILEYKRSHLNFVAKANEYPYPCPLELHCHYNVNQIMAAFDYFNEDQSPEFREGVKYFAEKKTDIFLINLNKSEKDFSPSTMYEDYAINAQLFHWQSQSQDRLASAKIQRYIHQGQTGNYISLFAREYKNRGSYTAPYIFLGNADYVKSSGERPVSFVWHLHTPIPASLLPAANKAISL